VTGEVDNVGSDVVQAVEQVFRGSRGPVLDVDKLAVQGTLDSLLNITTSTSVRRSISGLAVM